MLFNLKFEIERLGFSLGEFSRVVKVERLFEKINTVCDFEYEEVVRILEFFEFHLSADYLFVDVDTIS